MEALKMALTYFAVKMNQAMAMAIDHQRSSSRSKFIGQT